MKLADIQAELDKLCADEPFELVAAATSLVDGREYVRIWQYRRDNWVVANTRLRNDQGVLWTWMEGFEDALSLLTKLRLRK